MDESLLEFINRNVNATNANVAISREFAGNGREHIYISVDGKPWYNFWHDPNKSKSRDSPKHSGGKKPYVMVMTEKIDELKKNGIKNVEEMIGFLVCLGKYIEWNTGRLINVRSKKSLLYADIQKIYGCSNNKLNRILAELKEHDLLLNAAEGYFVSRSLIKKGKSKNKE
jgi:hypothetical protein